MHYQEKLYIPHNKELRRVILAACHDSFMAGHPEQYSSHQQNQKALVLWFGLVVLVGKKLMVQM
jgi:hypothetical protein